MVIKSGVDVNYGLLKVKKPFQVNDTIHVLDVCYDTDPLLIQTTTCVIPYSYNVFDSGAYQIDVLSSDNALRTLINNLNDYIVQKIQRYNPAMIDNKMFIDYLKVTKSNEVNSEFRLRFRNPHVDNVSSFDNQNNPIPTKSLSTFDRIVCLYQLQKVIIQKDSYYFQANIVQIKKINLLMATPKCCLIETISPNEKDYDIQQGQTQIAIKPKQAPLPPPPPPLKMYQNPPQYVRKTDCIRRTVHVDSQVTGYKAPTLDEILQARTKLKSINNISV